MWQNIKKFVIKLSHLLRENELKNIAILSSGVFAGQFISILAQPVATRLYTPKEFGILALISSLIGMFGPSLNGQYHLCIVSAPNDKEADAVTALSILFGIFISILVSIGIIIYIYISPDTFAEAGLWIYIVIPLLINAGFTNVLNSYNNRYKQYKLLASLSLYRAIASNIVKLGLGFAKVGFIGLISSIIISYVVGFKKQTERLRENIDAIFSTSKKELIDVLKKYKAQPLFSTPGLFVVTFSNNLIPVFISTLYGIKEVGYYSLAMAMLLLPISLLSSNIGTVYFRKASLEKAETGSFYRSFKSSVALLTLLSLIPFILLYFFAEPLFAFVFGAEWLRSGTFIQFLIPWYWMNFIVGTLVISLIISGDQLIKLIVQCLFIIASFVIYYAAKSMHLSIEQYLLSISLSFASIYALLLIIIYKTSRHKTAFITESQQTFHEQ